MRHQYSGVFRDGAGNIVASGTVAVYLAGTTTAASIYTTATGTTAVNSTTSGSDGTFTFYVDRFDYDRNQQFKIVLSKTGFSSKTYDYVDINNLITGTYTISADKTVTTDLGYIPKGVVYSVATGKTLTLNGTFSAGAYQIFAGAGTVTLSTNVPQVCVDWFGTNTTPGTTDMITAINAATNSITTGEVRFLGNIYAVSATILSSTALHPIKFKGTGKIEATGGTRIKWIGGNSDSIIELNSFMQMEDMYIYNGNAATGLIGIDMLGDSGQSKAEISLYNVHVKNCAVNYAFEYSYYVRFYGCMSSYGDIGFDLRTHANDITFIGCRVSTDVIGITNENGTASRGVRWIGDSIESTAAYGIKTLQASTQGWYFLNPHLESNYQHSINGHIKIDRPYINGDGGAGTRPPFDISGSAHVEIDSPYMSASITQLFTLSGLAAAYNSSGITIRAPFDAPEVATSIYATPTFLTGGYINKESYIKIETDWFDASGAIAENVITVGQADGIGPSATLVAAQLVVDTAVSVTASEFIITMGRSPAYNTYINTTFTTDRAVGVYDLPLVGAAPMTVSPASYTYRVTGTAETSGKYKIVLFFIK